MTTETPDDDPTEILPTPARVRDALGLALAAVLIGLGIVVPFQTPPLSGGTGTGALLLAAGFGLGAWRLRVIGRLR